MRKLHCAVCSVLCLALPTRAESPDPRAILEQADAAVRAIKVIRYEANSEADGLLKSQLDPMRGTVTMVTTSEPQFPKVLIDAKVMSGQGSEPVPVQIACDGRFATVVHYGEKTYVRRELPAGIMLLNKALPLLIREFTFKPPFRRELEAVSLKYVGTEKVGDVECDVVHAVYAEDGGEVRWHIGKADHVPRRVRRSFESPVGKTSMTTTVLSLETLPDVEPGLFHLEKPPGFREVGPPGSEHLLPVGSAAPDWTLKTPDGQEVTLQSLRGKIVLLDFWATWCGPCIRSMPHLQKLHEKYRDKPVAILGVNCYERDRRVDPAAFFKQRGLTYGLLLKGGRVAQAYMAKGIPTFYLIDPGGKILMAYSGRSEAMEGRIDRLISETLEKVSTSP